MWQGKFNRQKSGKLWMQNSLKLFIPILVTVLSMLGSENYLNLTSSAQDNIENPIPVKIRKGECKSVPIYSPTVPYRNESFSNNAENEIPVLLRPIPIRCTPPPTHQLNIIDM